MLQNPVNLTRDSNGTVQGQVPDVFEVHTFGEDEGKTLQEVDAVETASARTSRITEISRGLPPPSGT